MKMVKVHVTLWLMLLVGGFLLGYIPENRKNRELQTRLENPQKMIEALQLQLRMGELRDLAGLIFLELSRQNYGLARDYSIRYYEKLKEAISVVQDNSLKKSLEELASTQNALSLAAANPNSLGAWQPIVVRTYEVTKSGR